MAKKRSNGQCADCGKTGKLTLEHVPPKGCFTKPRPTPLPIYTCTRCNKISSEADEEMKVFIGATATNYSPKGQDLGESFMRSIKHNSKLRRRILSGKLTDRVYDDEGNLKPEVVNLTWDMKPLVPLWNKMARCLYYYEYGEVIPEKTVLEAPLMSPQTTLDTRITDLMETGYVGNDREFQYVVMRAFEVDKFSFHCQMLFWDRLRIDVSGSIK